MSAAASLTDAFTTIKDDFLDAPTRDAEIAINFGSSGQLSTQILEGAPADVAAFADEAPMTKLDDAGLLAAAPQIFARNQLIIVTKPGNPEEITSLADLATAGTIALCADAAPCGKFADQILTDGRRRDPRRRDHPRPEREGDLGSRHRRRRRRRASSTSPTRRRPATGSSTVDIPEADNVVANYPVAVIDVDAATRSSPRLFEDYVLGDAGQAVLREAGFRAP